MSVRQSITSLSSLPSEGRVTQALDIPTLRAFCGGVHARRIRTSPVFALDKLASGNIVGDTASILLDFTGGI
jgi:hypothetical protein